MYCEDFVRRVLKRTTVLLSLNMEIIIILTKFRLLQLLRYEFLASMFRYAIEVFSNERNRECTLTVHILSNSPRIVTQQMFTCVACRSG